MHISESALVWSFRKNLVGNIENYSISNYNTLISLLPDESKEIFCKNGYINLVPTPKFPTFDYASFCKILSIQRVHYKLGLLLKIGQSISPKNLNIRVNIMVQEIFKFFITQKPSLK